MIKIENIGAESDNVDIFRWRKMKRKKGLMMMEFRSMGKLIYYV